MASTYNDFDDDKFYHINIVESNLGSSRNLGRQHGKKADTRPRALSGRCVNFSTASASERT